jgi:DNA-binding transcriptional LysR family regulator
MDRRRLECFIALAEELHFQRAAQRCHISQPGLSQQLYKLEKYLQVQLVYRTKRHVALTSAGDVFLTEARKIVRSMDDALELARHTESGRIGRLTIGATAPALFVLLPEVMQRFASVLPDVQVVVQEMTTAAQEEALRRGDIHAGLVHPPLDDESLSCVEVARIPFDVVLSERNPLSERETLKLADLARETFVLFPRRIGPKLYDRVFALCQEAGFSPATVVEASPAQSIIAMAACNIGVGFIASHLQHFERPLAVYRKLTGLAPDLPLAVAHTGNLESPALRHFMDMTVTVGREVSRPT